MTSATAIMPSSSPSRVKSSGVLPCSASASACARTDSDRAVWVAI